MTSDGGMRDGIVPESHDDANPMCGFSKREPGIPPGTESTPRAGYRAPKTEPGHRKTRTLGMLSGRHPRAGPFSRPSTFRHRLHHDGERPTPVTSSLHHSVTSSLRHSNMHPCSGKRSWDT